MIILDFTFYANFVLVVKFTNYVDKLQYVDKITQALEQF